MSFVDIFVEAVKKAANRKQQAAKDAIDSGSAGTLGSTTQTGAQHFDPIQRPAPEGSSSTLPGGAEVEANSLQAAEAAAPAGPVPSPYPNALKAEAETATLTGSDPEEGAEHKIEGTGLAREPGADGPAAEHKVEARPFAPGAEHKVEATGPGDNASTEVKDSHDRFARSGDPEEGGEYNVEAVAPAEVAAGTAPEAADSDYFEVKIEDVLVSSASPPEQSWDVKENIKLAALEGIDGESSDAKHGTEFLAATREPVELQEDVAGSKFDVKIEGLKAESTELSASADFKFEGKIEGIKGESTDDGHKVAAMLGDEGAEHKIEGKIEGIKGESTDDGHKVAAMVGDEGVEHKVEGLMEEEGLASSDPSRASTGDLHVVKQVDKDSPVLMTREGDAASAGGADDLGHKVEAAGIDSPLADGEPEAGIPGDAVEELARKAGGEQLEYLKVGMEEVIVTGAVAGTPDEEPLVSTLVDLRAETADDELLSLAGAGDDGLAGLDAGAVLDLDIDDGPDAGDIEV